MLGCDHQVLHPSVLRDPDPLVRIDPEVSAREMLQAAGDLPCGAAFLFWKLLQEWVLYLILLAAEKAYEKNARYSLNQIKSPYALVSIRLKTTSLSLFLPISGF